MKRFVLPLLFSLPIFCYAQRFDVILKNGRIIDGSGNPWFYGDVGIRRGEISAVGDLSGNRAKRIVDVHRQVIAPGFIDVHTHIEDDETKTPTADNFIYDGVTSVLTGNCGASNVDLKTYFRTLNTIHLSVNVGSFIGHNDVRRTVLGTADIQPDAAQLKTMQHLVERAMKDGAIGFSTGLIYTPGTYSHTDEVVALASAAAKYHGVYTSHIRNESDQVFAAIDEAINVGRQNKMPVEISHFKVGKPNWGRTDEMIAMVEKARREGLDVTVDQYPYTASSTNLNVLAPSWMLSGGPDSIVARLADSTIKKKVVTEMLSDMKRRQQPDFSYAVVASCEWDPSLNGKNIHEITAKRGMKQTIPNEIETILYMIGKGGAAMVFHGMADADVENIMRYPLTMVASDSGIRLFNSGVPHPRGYGSNARVLNMYVREKGTLRLEDAIRKMTSLPAQKFALHNRGLLRPGMAADVVVFDPDAVRDRSTYEKPHAYSTGFSFVLVNGKFTVENGRHNGTRAGEVLYGPGHGEKL
ncbi:MAG: D-aminoacylase [Mucilaginibacter polytrichastri]|nr:D-aminoacylase [Mucilaginibacter polytrichastri]